jgi:predicted Rossmann-fold nucleotide-binding protein
LPSDLPVRQQISQSELHVVETMHQRKALMADLADAFVALPGGMGRWMSCSRS